MDEIIKMYSKAWKENDINLFHKMLSTSIDVVYRESNGMVRHGIDAVLESFAKSHKNREILMIKEKRLINDSDTLVVEYFLKCNHKGKIEEFESVTILAFDKDMKIYDISEYSI